MEKPGEDEEETKNTPKNEEQLPNSSPKRENIHQQQESRMRNSIRYLIPTPVMRIFAKPDDGASKQDSEPEPIIFKVTAESNPEKLTEDEKKGIEIDFDSILYKSISNLSPNEISISFFLAYFWQLI